MITILPVCSNCKGTNINYEATVSFKDFHFVVDEIMDKGHYCSDCDSECNINWELKDI